MWPYDIEYTPLFRNPAMIYNAYHKGRNTIYASTCCGLSFWPINCSLIELRV